MRLIIKLVCDIIELMEGKMTKDISLMEDGYKLNYRTAAIITCGDRILLQRGMEVDFWNMPGGRVKFGESSLEAIKRELAEELDLHIENPKLIAYCENFFPFDGKNYHELLTVYQYELPKDHPVANMETFYALDNFNVIYGWFNKGEVKNIKCKPEIIYSLVTKSDDKIIHSITRK